MNPALVRTLVSRKTTMAGLSLDLVNKEIAKVRRMIGILRMLEKSSSDNPVTQSCRPIQIDFLRNEIDQTTKYLVSWGVKPEEIVG